MFDFAIIKKKNICIMGLMGSGKSMIAKDLSKQFKIKFYDTDREIENKTNKSIDLIFEEKGESYFREIEEEVCLELLQNNNCIISLGGGSIINKKIRQSIELNSLSIYLKVDLNILAKRLKSSKKRPLLNKNENKIDILQNLYKRRQKFYEKADLSVDNNKDKYQVLEQIKYALELYEN